MRWPFARYNKRMEDPDKVKAIKDYLNKESGTQDWDDATGLYMFPNVMPTANGKSFSVNPSKGTTVKIFINTKTGELRPYWIGKLEKKNG